MSTSELTSTAAAVIEDAVAQRPGLGTDFCARELDACARDTLARVRCWQVEFPVNTRAGQADYRLDTRVPGTRISTLLMVAFDGRVIPPQPAPFGTLEAPGDPRSWSMPTPGVVSLAPAPSATLAGIVRVRAVLTPIDAIAAVPEDILLPLRDALLHGTLARLYAMPGKPWSSLQMTGAMMKIYRSQVNRLRAEYQAALNPAGRAWAFPRGWSRHG